MNFESRTGFLQTNNICDICHVDATLELKAGLALCREAWLIFTHHELSLLLVGIDVLAAQKNTLKKEDMVLKYAG